MQHASVFCYLELMNDLKLNCWLFKQSHLLHFEETGKSEIDRSILLGELLVLGLSLHSVVFLRELHQNTLTAIDVFKIDWISSSISSSLPLTGANAALLE